MIFDKHGARMASRVGISRLLSFCTRIPCGGHEHVLTQISYLVGSMNSQDEPVLQDGAVKVETGHPGVESQDELNYHMITTLATKDEEVEHNVIHVGRSAQPKKKKLLSLIYFSSSPTPYPLTSCLRFFQISGFIHPLKKSSAPPSAHPNLLASNTRFLTSRRPPASPTRPRHHPLRLPQIPRDSPRPPRSYELGPLATAFSYLRPSLSMRPPTPSCIRPLPLCRRGLNRSFSAGV